MKRFLFVVLTLLSLFALSCSHNIYLDERASCVARVGNVYFSTIQEAINYACDYEAKNLVTARNTTVNVLVSSYKGPGLYVPATDKNITVEFDNCVYEFTDDTTIALDFWESDNKVVFNNATFVINSTNNSIEYVYRIKTDYYQDHVVIDDRRGINKDNCLRYIDKQKVYISDGTTVSFGDSCHIDGKDNVVGWLTLDEDSTITLLSGSYTFWSIPTIGTINIEDYVTIKILKKDKETVNNIVQGKSAVEVIILDEECLHPETTISSRGATCSREGLVWEQCTSCGTCIRIISRTSKTDHTFGTTWSMDTEEHWHECSVCGEEKDRNIHNQHKKSFDDYYHWFGCDICGYETEKEEHIWGTDNKCTVCGLSKPDHPSGSGGFSVNVQRRGPMGELTATEEDNIWTITLKDTNTGFPITGIKWKQDDEHMGDYDNSYEYILSKPYPRTYFISCVISNNYGSTTLEIVVRGKS